MQIRTATMENLPVIIKIFLDCWKISYTNVLPAEIREAMNEEAAADLWRPSFDNPSRTTFIVEAEGKPVAVFRTGLDPDEEERWHLFSLYVAPEAAGKGIGTFILDEVLKQARVAGHSSVNLWVFDANAIAKKLYAKAGFSPSGRSRVREWRELEVELVNPNI